MGERERERALNCELITFIYISHSSYTNNNMNNYIIILFASVYTVEKINAQKIYMR